MGYLANKKHEARVNTFLKIFLTLSAFVTFLAFGTDSVSLFLNEHRWHFYLLLFAAFFYALRNRYYLYMFLAFVLGTINFFAVSSIVNILGSSGHETAQTTLLFGSRFSDIPTFLEQVKKQHYDIVAVTAPQTEEYDIEEMVPQGYKLVHAPNDWSKGYMLSSPPIEVSGRFVLSSNLYADFIKVSKGEKKEIYVAVDLSTLNNQQISSALENLSAFVLAQDDPVVIFGNFNMVAWSPAMSKFIETNGLRVKNALFDNLRNFVVAPHYYILGYESNHIKGQLFFSGLKSFPMFTRF